MELRTVYERRLAGTLFSVPDQTVRGGGGGVLRVSLCTRYIPPDPKSFIIASRDLGSLLYSSDIYSISKPARPVPENVCRRGGSCVFLGACYTAAALKAL